MKLSLIIPCYNEEKNIPLLIEKCKPLLETKKIEIILVDNGSTDNTENILKKYQGFDKSLKTIKLKENRGYGGGILAGLDIAKNEFIGWTHADLQANPKDCIIFLQYIEKSKDPLNTFLKGKRYGRNLIDRFFTVMMTIFEFVLLKSVLIDINAQPTIFHKEFFKKWNNPPNDFSLDLYAFFFAKKLNMNIIRFPVYFGQRIYGQSSWNRGFIDRYKFIKRTILYSIKLNKKFKK